MREQDVASILLGDRRQVHADAGQVDVLARAELAAVERRGSSSACSLISSTSRLIRPLSTVILSPTFSCCRPCLGSRRGRSSLRCSRAGLTVSAELSPTLSSHVVLQLTPVRISGPMQVEQDRDRVVQLAVQALDAPDADQVRLVIAVRHVQARDVHAGRRAGFSIMSRRVAGRADGADDLACVETRVARSSGVPRPGQSAWI